MNIDDTISISCIEVLKNWIYYRVTKASRWLYLIQINFIYEMKILTSLLMKQLSPKNFDCKANPKIIIIR